MLLLSVLRFTLTAIPNTGHVFSCIVPLSHGILSSWNFSYLLTALIMVGWCLKLNQANMNKYVAIPQLRRILSNCLKSKQKHTQ